MSHTYESWQKTAIRRKGGMEIVCESDLHGVMSDRRSRQISKRHWLRKESMYSSSGGGSHCVTRKLAGKKEEFLISAAW